MVLTMVPRALCRAALTTLSEYLREWLITWRNLFEPTVLEAPEYDWVNTLLSDLLWGWQVECGDSEAVNCSPGTKKWRGPTDPHPVPAYYWASRLTCSILPNSVTPSTHGVQNIAQEGSCVDRWYRKSWINLRREWSLTLALFCPQKVNQSQSKEQIEELEKQEDCWHWVPSFFSWVWQQNNKR